MHRCRSEIVWLGMCVQCIHFGRIDEKLALPDSGVAASRFHCGHLGWNNTQSNRVFKEGTNSGAGPPHLTFSILVSTKNMLLVIVTPQKKSEWMSCRMYALYSQKFRMGGAGEDRLRNVLIRSFTKSSAFIHTHIHKHTSAWSQQRVDRVDLKPYKYLMNSGSKTLKCYAQVDVGCDNLE